MPCKKPNWILLKECGEKLTSEGKTPFTRKQLIDCVHEKHPERGENSLRPMIQGMTVNLRGGAPGGLGKKIFYSVARGLFELYDAKKHGHVSIQVKEATIEPSAYKKTEEIPSHTEASEDEIRDLLMQILYHRIGKEGSWQDSGKSASFDLRDEFKGYKCFAEKSLPYDLPKDVKLDHTSDILIVNEEKKKYISIEIKYRSAVTDQFKCRSYDMIHLKESYKDDLLGIMVYIKSKTGIRIEHARSICYPFDYFFGIPSESRHIPTAWDKLTLAIVEFLKK